MAKVESMARRLGDPRRWTPEQMIEDVLQDLRSGERSATKAVVILYDDSDPYDVEIAWRNAQLSDLELVGLLTETALTISNG